MGNRRKYRTWIDGSIHELNYMFCSEGREGFVYHLAELFDRIRLTQPCEIKKRNQATDNIYFTYDFVFQFKVAMLFREDSQNDIVEQFGNISRKTLGKILNAFDNSNSIYKVAQARHLLSMQRYINETATMMYNKYNIEKHYYQHFVKDEEKPRYEAPSYERRTFGLRREWGLTHKPFNLSPTYGEMADEDKLNALEKEFEQRVQEYKGNDNQQPIEEPTMDRVSQLIQENQRKQAIIDKQQEELERLKKEMKG